VAQESEENRKPEPGEVERAGATKVRESVVLVASGLTGCWESGERGGWLVWLVQRGNRVWGYYVPNRPGRKGHLHGTIEGNRFDYYWWENQENGQGYFELEDDARSMNGKWHYDFSKSWGGDWSLSRTTGTKEAATQLEAVAGAVDGVRAKAGELAQAFQAQVFAADPRSRVHDSSACAEHADQMRATLPAVSDAVTDYARLANHVDGYAGKIAKRLVSRAKQVEMALDAHENTKYLPAANRAMERVKDAVHELDDCFVWLEASFAIEVACRRLRIHLAAAQEAQGKDEFQRALKVVRQTAAALQAHYLAKEDPVGVGLAGQMLQMANELDEIVVAGLDAGGELRAAALDKVRAGYTALLAKKREIDVICATASP
jgi:hypothetical protein